MKTFLLNNKSITFYIYILCFAVAKAWGYTAADKGYFVLAAIGSLFCFLAIIGSRYTRREIAYGLVIVFVGLLSMILSHKIGAIFPAMLFVASKDIDVDKSIKVLMYFWVPVMILRIVCSIFGIVPMVIEAKRSYINDGVLVYGLGYCTGNCFYTILVVAVMFAIYNYWNNMRIWWSVVVAFISFVAFILSRSLSGFIILLGTAILIIVYKLVCLVPDIRKQFCLFLNTILCVGIGFPVVATFILLIAYGHNDKLDHIMKVITTNRAWVNYEMSKVYRVSIFGQKFDGRYSYEMVDNAFFYTFISLGICMFVLFTVLYGICIFRTYKMGDTRRLFVLCAFFVYGFMEQFFINPFMNFSMLFICDILWDSNKQQSIVDNEISS